MAHRGGTFLALAQHTECGAMALDPHLFMRK
jgi:hypothetical protein